MFNRAKVPNLIIYIDQLLHEKKESEEMKEKNY